MPAVNFQNLRFVHDRTAEKNDIECHKYEEFVQQTRRYLLSHAVAISEGIFPDIFRVLATTGHKIAPNLSIEAFIIPNHIPQAYYIHLSSKKNLALVLTSAIVDLLSREEMQFVIGHELGHHIYQHHKHSIPEHSSNELTFLRQLFISRCHEISADRIGFIASSSVDDALRGMLKIASGLKEQHIKLNIPVFLDQIKQIKNMSGRKEGAYLSHPLIPLRMRALLWFSMSDSYYEAIGHSGKAPLTNKLMEQYISKDLHDISDSAYLDQEYKACGNILLWASLKIATINGVLGKQDQIFIKEFVDRELFDKAISFLKSNKKNHARVINERLKAALHNGKGIRLEKITKIEQTLVEISMHLLSCPDSANELMQEINTLAQDM